MSEIGLFDVNDLIPPVIQESASRDVRGVTSEAVADQVQNNHKKQRAHYFSTSNQLLQSDGSWKTLII